MRRCAEVGLQCERGDGGKIRAYGEPFLSLLRRHGIEAAAEPAPFTQRGSSRMKKWSCGCTNIRAAVAVDAQCRRCGGTFQRLE